MTPDPRFDDLPPDAQLRIDAACDRFEAEWQAGRTPSLDQYLAAADPADRPALEAALRALDSEYRRATPAPPVRPADLITSPLVSPPAVSTDSGPPGRGAAALLPPVPGYELLEELGRGGMGVVHKARDTRLNRVVALKRIIRADATRASVARFWAEAEVMAAVRHPHVVPVYELGEHDGLPFLAMEYLPGGSLAERVRAAAPMPAADAAGLVGKVAAGVAAAHEQGIVHRDLKPGNVLLDAAGEPKVTDFGLAKRRAADLTATQALMGTPAYMAPEQAAGRAKFVGPQADVWALGVILYECLTGKRPFAADTVESLLRQIMSDDPVPLRTLAGRVPRDLDTIVSRCLAKEPADRYPTAAELAADLGRFVRGEPVAARPIGLAERAARWVRRHPTWAAAWGLGGTAAALLAVTLVVAVLWRDAAGARDTAEQARGDLKDANAKLEDVLTGERTARGEAEQARNGEATAKRQVAFLNYVHAVDLAFRDYLSNDFAHARGLLESDSCPPGLRGWEWRHVHRLCNSGRLTLAGHQQRVTAASFSPDGKRVVTGSMDRTARVWDADTGELRHVLTGHGGIVQSASFSPDGRRVVTAALDGAARVWDADTGKQLILLRPGAAQMFTTAYSADGTRIVTASLDRTARVWDADTGKELAVCKGHTDFVMSVAFSADGKRVVTGSVDGSTRVWDAGTGDPVAVLRRPNHFGAGAVLFVSFTADGKRVVNQSGVWEVGTGKLLVECPGGLARALSPDEKRMAAFLNSGITLVDAESGAQLVTLRGYRLGGGPVQFSGDGARIVAAAQDNTARVWDVGSGEELAVLKGHTDAVTSVAFTADGRRVLTAGDNTVRVWDVDAEAGVRDMVLKGHTNQITSASFSADGTRVMTAGGDFTTRLWDARSGKELASRAANQNPYGKRSTFLAWNGRRVVTSSEDGTTRVADAESGKDVVVLRGHSGEVTSASFSDDGGRVAMGVWGGSTQVWDVASGRPLARVQGAAPRLSGNGKRVFTHGGVVWRYQVWDADTGRQLTTLEGEVVWVSADGTRAITTLWDGTARVWDTDAGRELFALKGHTKQLRAAALSSDGRRLLTAGDDRTVRVWSDAGQLMLTLPGHLGNVLAVAFSPDGSQVLSAGHDGTESRDLRVIVYDSRPVDRTVMPHEVAAPPWEKPPVGKNP